MAYHYIRLYLQDKARPHRLRQARRDGAETVWEVELVNRTDQRPEGKLVIGVDTGSVYGFTPAAREGASVQAAERSA